MAALFFVIAVTSHKIIVFGNTRNISKGFPQGLNQCNEDTRYFTTFNWRVLGYARHMAYGMGKGRASKYYWYACQLCCAANQFSSTKCEQKRSTGCLIQSVWEIFVQQQTSYY